MNPDGEETIRAAALWIDDGKSHPQQPVPTGLLFCGAHHAACLEQSTVTGFGTRLDRVSANQGFLTSRRRFVDRKEALQIALWTGQVNAEDIPGDELYAEFLRW